MERCKLRADFYDVKQKNTARPKINEDQSANGKNAQCNTKTSDRIGSIKDGNQSDRNERLTRLICKFPSQESFPNADIDVFDGNSLISISDVNI